MIEIAFIRPFKMPLRIVVQLKAIHKAIIDGKIVTIKEKVGNYD